MFNSSPELEGQTPVALLHQACPPCESELEVNFPRQQCLITGSSKGALFYCQSSNVEQLTVRWGPEDKILEWPGKYGLSFTFPRPAQPTPHTPPPRHRHYPPIPKPQAPGLATMHLSLHSVLNCQQCEKADTNKGDLAQRDAEWLLSLVWRGDQSRDLTERDSWPLVHWQWLYW